MSEPMKNTIEKGGGSLQKLKLTLGAVPPTALVILSICTTQVGAAFAKGLFTSLGSAGTVALRVGFAFLLMLLIWRPRFRGYTREAYLNCCLFGLSLAAMNFFFYSALAHIPLGVAVTLEFVGPLGVAVMGSRRPLDILWVVMAASGIVCLAPWTGTGIHIVGMILALMAGGCWGAYIIFSSRVGRAVPGVNGLVMAMGVASVLLIPIGVVSAGTKLLDINLLFIGLGIALLSSVIPYSLEMDALRRLPTHVFGLFMSMEPAIAALVGMIFLGEAIEMRTLLAIVLITIAMMGTIKGNG